MTHAVPVEILPFLSTDGHQFECLNNDRIDRILKTVRDHLGTEIAFVSRYVDGSQKQLTHVSSDVELPMGPGFTDAREDSY